MTDIIERVRRIQQYVDELGAFDHIAWIIVRKEQADYIRRERGVYAKPELPDSELVRAVFEIPVLIIEPGEPLPEGLSSYVDLREIP